MLLNSKYTKPEEIWFVNRNHSTDNGSRIYSLKEYLVRSKDYSKPYLEGDFQAIPYIIDPYMEGL